MNSKNINTKTTSNLIGQNKFRQFLDIQSVYGFAQRGGSIISAQNKTQSKRLVSDVNILESAELKKIVFNELIFGN